MKDPGTPDPGIAPAVRATVPLEVHETETSVLVRVTLPGVQADDVQVQIQGDTLTITAARRPAISSAASPADPEVTRHDEVRAEDIASAQQKREGDPVTRESQDSFPSSDPPSWTGERT